MVTTGFNSVPDLTHYDPNADTPTGTAGVVNPLWGMKGNAYLNAPSKISDEQKECILTVRNLPPGEIQNVNSLKNFVAGAIIHMVKTTFGLCYLDGPAVVAVIEQEDRSMQMILQNKDVLKLALKLNGLAFCGYLLIFEHPQDIIRAEKDLIESVRIVENPDEKPEPEAKRRRIEAEALEPPAGPQTGEAFAYRHWVEPAPFVLEDPSRVLYASDMPKDATEVEVFELLLNAAPNHDCIRRWWLPDQGPGRIRGVLAVELESEATCDSMQAQLDDISWKGRYVRAVVASQYIRKSLEMSIKSSHEYSKHPTPPNVYTTHGTVAKSNSSISERVFSSPLSAIQIKRGKVIGSMPSRIVQLLNVVFPEDLIPEDEYNMWLNETAEEASRFGQVMRVVIPRPVVQKDCITCPPGVGKILVQFGELQAAKKAQYEFNGSLTGDRVICASFFPEDLFDAGQLSTLS